MDISTSTIKLYKHWIEKQRAQTEHLIQLCQRHAQATQSLACKVAADLLGGSDPSLVMEEETASQCALDRWFPSQNTSHLMISF